MTTPFLPVPVFRAFDSAGLPLAGGLLYAYQAGTTTPQDTYSDSAGVTPNSNPVVLDSSGSAVVRLGTSPYKFVLKNSGGATQWTTDNYVPIGDSATFSGNVTIGGTLSVAGVLTTAAINTTGNVAITGNETISGSLTVGGATVVTVATGTFTPVWTGFAVAPTGDLTWYKIDHLVFLYFGGTATGTSNATSMQITNIPAAIRASTGGVPASMPIWVTDNGAVAAGAFSFSGASKDKMDFYKGTAPPSATGFTNAGTKGLGFITHAMWIV